MGARVLVHVLAQAAWHQHEGAPWLAEVGGEVVRVLKRKHAAGFIKVPIYNHSGNNKENQMKEQ